jgi:hypothetical protein
MPLYLFSVPYVRLQQGQFRFKYAFHIVPGTAAPFILPFLARFYVPCVYHSVPYVISIISQHFSPHDEL